MITSKNNKVPCLDTQARYNNEIISGINSYMEDQTQGLPPPPNQLNSKLFFQRNKYCTQSRIGGLHAKHKLGYGEG